MLDSELETHTDTTLKVMRRLGRSAKEPNLSWNCRAGTKKRNRCHRQTLAKVNYFVVHVKANHHTLGWIILDDAAHVESKGRLRNRIETADRLWDVTSTKDGRPPKISFAQTQESR